MVTGVKGGEAYLLTVPDPALGSRKAERVVVYRVTGGIISVICIGPDGDDWYSSRPVPREGVPAGWRLAGLAAPSARTHDGRDCGRVPGPPWGRDLTWAAPGPVILHDPGERPGWLGAEACPVSGPCRSLAEAQAAADAWWLAEVTAFDRGTPDGQLSLFGGAA